MAMIVFPCIILTLGGFVFLGLTLLAAQHQSPLAKTNPKPVSVLKPLAGLDLGLAANLRTFFEQRYAAPWEILFAVRHKSDPAVPIVEKLQREYPQVTSRLIEVGEPPYANAKVWSLDQMMRQAQYDLLVMSDSDIRVDENMLTALAQEEFDLTTCPYRAVGGPSLWSRLEAAGLNTEFIAGLLVARLVEGGVKFAVGPTIAARKKVIETIGGFDKLKDYLAEDFVMGARAAAQGFRVTLSRYVVEHHIGSEPLGKNFAHRLRWNRSTRRSRPGGYAGQIFTNPLPAATLLWLVAPAWWPLAAGTIALRFFTAFYVARQVLHAGVNPLLVAVQDWLSLCFWLAGFFGNTIEWRGRRYRLHADGTFTLVASA
jgi:ceramide glucosyltransferase